MPSEWTHSLVDFSFETFVTCYEVGVILLCGRAKLILSFLWKSTVFFGVFGIALYMDSVYFSLLFSLLMFELVMFLIPKLLVFRNDSHIHINVSDSSLGDILFVFQHTRLFICCGEKG